MLRSLVVVALCITLATAQIANTTYGSVQGFTTATNKVWLGIPFAAPPTAANNLRFKPPQPPAAWTTTYSAQAYGNTCQQSSSSSLVTFSEDCLYLNIWAPLTSTPTSNLPVYVFIYGGSFLSGSSTPYNGSYLAGQDIIVVTINYRVGAFGFIYHPAVAAANTLGTAGFFGIQDQRMALQFVQNNIAAFGGNPSQVTLGGESAGAISICLHLTAPKSTGLFSQILSESGNCYAFPPSNGTAVGTYVARTLGCTGTNAQIYNCLNSASVSDILAAQSSIAVFFPTADPYEYSGSTPAALLSSGSFTSVRTMIGTNLNETTYILCYPPYYSQITGDDQNLYRFLLEMPTAIPQIPFSTLSALYPLGEFGSILKAAVEALSDESFKCWARTLADQSAIKGSTVYMYSFNHYTAATNAKISGCLGASHADELYYLWPSLLGYRSLTLNAAEQNLSSIMRNAWVTFVSSGAPALPNSNTWPVYTAATEQYEILDTPISYGSGFRNATCPIFDLTKIGAIGVSIPVFTDVTTPAPTSIGSQMIASWALFVVAALSLIVTF